MMKSNQFFNNSPQDWQVSCFRVDWNNPLALDSKEYTTEITYDALNRVKTMTIPEDLDSKRKGIRPEYNNAGAPTGASFDLCLSSPLCPSLSP